MGLSVASRPQAIKSKATLLTSLGMTFGFTQISTKLCILKDGYVLLIQAQSQAGQGQKHLRYLIREKGGIVTVGRGVCDSNCRPPAAGAHEKRRDAGALQRLRHR